MTMAESTPYTDVSLSVTILRKETLIMRLDSMASRDRLIADFRECIETASSRKLISLLLATIDGIITIRPCSLAFL